MLRRRAKSSDAEQHEIASFDHGHATVPVPMPLPPAFASPAPPKLFLACSGEASPERPEGVTSPTSILQAASLTSPAACVRGGAAVPTSRRGNGHHRPWETTPVGLGLVGALNGEAAAASTVLAGQRLLMVQTHYYHAPCSPSSREFGVRSRSGAGDDLTARRATSRRRCMSPMEMEMSEDYTCVIARGPNPRTTHIFDNRVVESRGGFSSAAEWAAAGTDDFLRYCHGCSKDLGQGKDIFMYRGERAFCSRECRNHEMLFDEGMEEL